ncbi:hypothetical protein Tco_0893676 [Tanacetum coccineum]|uniref:Uncharacterized protein n=1 Tax=Tanacetum coccineum TaxID=301880 RepID=A0ABQ5CFU1_9ASTR
MPTPILTLSKNVCALALLIYSCMVQRFLSFTDEKEAISKSKAKKKREIWLVNGLFQGINIGEGLVNISHMFYADDAVFVGQWCDRNIPNAPSDLECFQKVSGFQITCEKVKSWVEDVILVNEARSDVRRYGSRNDFLNGRCKMLVIGGRSFKFNKTLTGVYLGKRWNGWRFFSQGNSLWARTIKAIHGSNGLIGTTLRKGYKSCWTSIIREMESLSKHGINVMQYMHIKLGDGESSKFWYDNWCEDGVLKDIYPHVYALELCKNVTVAAKLRQVDLSQSFRRQPQLEKSGEFSVASIRKLIDDKTLPSSDYITRWNKSVPIKEHDRSILFGLPGSRQQKFLVLRFFDVKERSSMGIDQDIGEEELACRAQWDREIRGLHNTVRRRVVVANILVVAVIPQHNGLVKETNVTLLAKVRCFLIQYGLSKVFRAEDTTMSTYLVTRSPSSAIGFKTPIDMLRFFCWLASKRQGMLEPVKDHTFEVEPQENVDQGAGLQEVQTQDLMDYQLARDREQHLACELFKYREDSNEAAFTVAEAKKIYAHESLTFNNTVACKVISKWKAGLKDDMDARSDVLRSGLPRVCWLKQREIYLVWRSSGIRVGTMMWKKNGKWSCIYAVGSQEYQMVCTRLDIASADVGMLDKFDRGLQTDVQVFVDFDYAMGRSIISGVYDTYGGCKEGYLAKETRNRVRIRAKDSSGYCYRCLVKGYP